MAMSAQAFAKAILEKLKGHEKPVTLWSGAWYMDADKTITLPRSVSSLPHGLVFVFSRYANGAAQSDSYTTYFVSKADVADHNGHGRSFLVSGVPFSPIGMKYLYISDTTVNGNDVNIQSGTKSGVTYNNKSFVLREIYGI